MKNLARHPQTQVAGTRRSSTFALPMGLLSLLLLLGGLPATSQTELQLTAEDLTLMQLPAHVSVPAHVVRDGKLWYFGARLPVDPVIAFDEIWAYDIAADSWELQPFFLPYEGSNSSTTTAAFAGGRFFMSPLFATGDAGGWGTHRRVVVADPTNGLSFEGPSFPQSRIWGTAPLAAEGKVFFFGGWTGSPQSGIWELDPSTLNLVQVANMSQPSNDVMPTLGADGWIYYWGRLLSKIERFHPVSYQVEVLQSETGFPAPADSAYVRWHLPADRTIYFTKAGSGAVASTPLFAFDYADDLVTPAGVEVPGDVINQQVIHDLDNPGVVYALRLRTDFGSPMTVSRLTLSPACIFGPEEPLVFRRAKGKPQFDERFWESCGGDGVMIVEIDRVSSALVYLNGELVLGPRDFRRRPEVLAVAVTLLEGENVLSVKLRGGGDDDEDSDSDSDGDSDSDSDSDSDGDGGDDQAPRGGLTISFRQ